MKLSQITQYLKNATGSHVSKALPTREPILSVKGIILEYWYNLSLIFLFFYILREGVKAL
jgi:hypothetical protein